MNKILTYILIFLTFSCVEKKKESESDIKVEKKEKISISTDSTELKAEPLVETKNSDSLFIDPNDFKYSNLKEIGTLGKWIKN